MNIFMVGIIVRPGREDANKYAEEIKKLFKNKMIAVAENDEITENINHKMIPDVLIALGGDGTLLRAVQIGSRADIPVIGYNFGKLGFLTEDEMISPEKLLDMLYEDRYIIDRRMLLEVKTTGFETEYSAMNDVVLTRGGYARLISVEALVDDKVIGRYTADGLIISTPTGSTGYSLSAGGPIVSPELNCIVITPICAHSLQHRPIVISADSEIILQLYGDNEQTASLQIDGKNVQSLINGSEINIVFKGKKVLLMRKQKTDFFSLVDRKLIEWGNN